MEGLTNKITEFPLADSTQPIRFIKKYLRNLQKSQKYILHSRKENKCLIRF